MRSRTFLVLTLPVCIFTTVSWGLIHTDYILVEQSVLGASIVAKGTIGLFKTIWPILILPSLILSWCIAIIQAHFIKFADKKTFHKAIEEKKHAQRQAAQAEKIADNVYKIAMDDSKKELRNQFAEVNDEKKNAERLRNEAEYIIFEAKGIRQGATSKLKRLEKKLQQVQQKKIRAWAVTERFKKQRNEALALVEKLQQ